MIAKDVGGEAIEVVVLLPPGASPHGYEPGPEAVRAMARADVHLLVGRGLDDWAGTLARGADPGARIERLAYGLPGPEPPADEHDAEGEPHVWLDPLKAAAMAERIGAILSEVRPAEAAGFRERATAAARRYEALEREAADHLAGVADVPFVAYHGGLNHLVARFGLRQIAVLEPFPGREPSPRYLKDVIDRIRESGARVVLSEPQFSAQLALVIARDAGVGTAEIDLIGGGPGRATYEEFFRAVADGLEGSLRRAAGEAGQAAAR